MADSSEYLTQQEQSESLTLGSYEGSVSNSFEDFSTIFKMEH